MMFDDDNDNDDYDDNDDDLNRASCQVLLSSDVMHLNWRITLGTQSRSKVKYFLLRNQRSLGMIQIILSGLTDWASK